MRKSFISVSIIMFFFAFLFFAGQVSAESGFGWGYKKNNENKIPEIGKYKDLLDKYGAYFADNSGEKVIYLTFDNGYEEGYTDNILDVLKKENVPATFFVTGHYVESKPKLVKRIVDEGHIVGNHSYHHPDFTTVTKKSMRKELESLEDAVAEVSDQEEMKYLRPPRGMFNEDTLEWANELGYIHIFWSLAFKDWETDHQQGWKYAYKNIMEQIHPGAIVLLHTVSSDNAKALDKVITSLKEKGYKFKSLDYLVMKDMLPRPVFGY